MSMNLDQSPTKVSPPAGYFRSNRDRLVANLAPKIHAATNACILLKGGSQHLNYDDDVNQAPFSQDNHFWWCTGVGFADCNLAIEVSTNKATLFVHQPDVSAKTWSLVLDPPDYLSRFEVDDCKPNTSMEEFFLAKNFDQVLTLNGVNCYSGNGPLKPEFPWLQKFIVNQNILYSTMNETRVRKTADEVALLKQVGQLASDGHIFVMRNLKPGMSESHVQSLFRFYNGWYMDSKTPYEEIAAIGGNGAILHYKTNDDILKDGEMVLFDGGAKVHHFCSDITSTWPLNGKFTQRQAEWYNVVLKASW
jgi:Xaa-Pro aminopeptidase